MLAGVPETTIPCFNCGRRKRLATDVCDYCGDDPVAYPEGQDAAAEIIRAFNAEVA